MRSRGGKGIRKVRRQRMGITKERGKIIGKTDEEKGKPSKEQGSGGGS